jgi:hypothetical protein
MKLEKLEKRQVLGIVIGNPLTTKKDIKKLFNSINHIGSRVYRNNE